MRTTIIIAGLALAGLVGPRPAAPAGLPGFTLSARTPRLSFYSRGSSVNVAKVEASLTRIESALGTRLAGHASYYRYASAQEVAAGTGYHAAGVTFAGQVHSTKDCHDHEIVHLVAAQMGDPGAFFREGLAVALGDDDARGQRRAAKKALAGGQPMTRWVGGFDGQDPDAAYAVAGAFVRHLIDDRGIDTVRAFYRAARSEAGAPRAFAAAFGRSLDEEFAAWTVAL